jgi:hypothetical protein
MAARSSALRASRTLPPGFMQHADLLLGNNRETNIEQHPLLGNKFLISKYPQPLLNNVFANKHVLTAKNLVQE